MQIWDGLKDHRHRKWGYKKYEDHKQKLKCYKKLGSIHSISKFAILKL